MRATPRLQLTVILAVALALRVILVFTTSGYSPLTDASDFDRNALALASDWHLPASVLTFHGGPTAFRPPAFSLLLSLVYRISGVGDAHTRWQAARLLEACLGAVTVLFIALIARRVFSARVALVAGAIAAIYPPLILVGTSLLSESLFIPLVLAAVLAALQARATLTSAPTSATAATATARASAWCALAGVLTAAAALARSNGIVIVIALACLVWVRRPRLSRRALVAPAVLIAFTALALVPWTIRNAEVFHQFVPTTTETGYALAGVYNPTVQGGDDAYAGFWEPPLAEMHAISVADPRVNEAQMDARLTSDALHYIDAHPFSVLRETYWSLKSLLDLDGANFERWIAHLIAYPPTLAVLSIYSFWALALLVIAGILAMIRRRGLRGGAVAFWACPVLLFLTTVPIAGDTRYRAPVDPFLVLVAAAALVAGWERWRARSAAA